MALCFANYFGLITIPPGPRVAMIFVLLISMMSARYYDGNEFTLSWAFMGSGLYLINQVIASYFLTYFIIPRFFFQKRYGVALICFVIGSYLICALGPFLVGVLHSAFDSWRPSLLLMLGLVSLQAAVGAAAGRAGLAA